MTTRDETAIALRSLERRQALRRTTRRIFMFVAFLVVLALVYTGYKAFGESIDGAQTEWAVIGTFLPRTDDLTMPPLADIMAEFSHPPQRNSDKPLAAFIFEASLFTLREAAFGFLFGVILGLGIAIVMLQSRWLERATSPYLVASQTIPLVAIAPIIVIWGATAFQWLPFEWEGWMSVALIATYLTFFPVAMNGIKGLQSADAASVELMRSYAASRRQTLMKLQLPAAAPYLFAAFKIAATGAIVGAIVGEISGGIRGGLGRLILDFASRYTTGPERLYATVIGAAVLGLIAVGTVTLVEYIVMSNRSKEPVATMSETVRTAVNIANVAKVFNPGKPNEVRALDHINLSIEDASFVSLIGPSGCGKSTLLRLMGALTHPTEGEVVINGKSADQARLDRDYGMAFQTSGLFDWRTVTQNVELPLQLMRWSKSDRKERAAEMLDLVKLSEFGDHYPRELSGGMQQRVSIARALSFRPSLLLMDEPFGALDEMTREHMQTEVLDIWGKTGKTIVFVTHSIPEAVFLSQRVIVMSPRPGRIASDIAVDFDERVFETRESPEFFDKITEVREALRFEGDSE